MHFVRLVIKAKQTSRISWDWFTKRHKLYAFSEIGSQRHRLYAFREIVSQSDTNFTHFVRLVIKAKQTSCISWDWLSKRHKFTHFVRLGLTATQTSCISWDWFSKRKRLHAFRESGSQSDTDLLISWDWFSERHRLYTFREIGSQSDTNFKHFVSLVPKAAAVMVVIVWGVQSCSLVAVYRRFRGAGYIHQTVCARFVCEVEWLRLKLMNMIHWWSDTDSTKPRYSVRNLPPCHFMLHKSHMRWPGIESGPPSEKPAVNRLSGEDSFWSFNRPCVLEGSKCKLIRRCGHRRYISRG
jgi:hypothetical protein